MSGQCLSRPLEPVLRVARADGQASQLLCADGEHSSSLLRWSGHVEKPVSETSLLQELRKLVPERSILRPKRLRCALLQYVDRDTARNLPHSEAVRRRHFGDAPTVRRVPDFIALAAAKAAEGAVEASDLDDLGLVNLTAEREFTYHLDFAGILLDDLTVRYMLSIDGPDTVVAEDIRIIEEHYEPKSGRLHIERIEHPLSELAVKFPDLARDIERAAQADADHLSWFEVMELVR